MLIHTAYHVLALMCLTVCWHSWTCILLVVVTFMEQWRYCKAVFGLVNLFGAVHPFGSVCLGLMKAVNQTTRLSGVRI